MVEKVVSASAGMSTVVVGGDVVKVTFEGHSVNYVFIRHVSGEILASRSPNVADSVDGTVKLSAGGYRFDVSAPVIYISGSGVCEVSASALGDFPFKASWKGGEVPDLSAYAKTADVPDIKVNEAVNSDTVNGHTVNADVPENAVFTDTIVNTRDLTINFEDITWVETAAGKYYYLVAVPNVTKRISVSISEPWSNFYPDDILQPTVKDDQFIVVMSNTNKSIGFMTIKIAYI